MTYQVLARKYRPRQFSELVGQSHVSRILFNSFQKQSLKQVYLFTGTRGIGKTSVARIFAKALRCEDPDSQPGKKNYGIACDKCPSCLEIIQGSSIDVLEIDGASNNGVENVREIRDQVKFLPARGTVRVYIIDEVHMLSNAAFNALLKTLEEPPPHVKFFLATTEVQKIPPTILSRCQRFDLKRVPLPLIYSHLEKIMQLEKVDFDPSALRLVAQKCDGSVRDALSALDQCLALGEQRLSVDGVTQALGIVSESFLLKILAGLLQHQFATSAALLEEAFQAGVEMKYVATGLAEVVRNGVFFKLQIPQDEIKISADLQEEYKKFSASTNQETLQAAYKILIEAVDDISNSPLPKTSLEMALLKICSLGQLLSLQDALTKLGKAEVKSPETAQARATSGFIPPPNQTEPLTEKKNLNTKTPIFTGKPRAAQQPIPSSTKAAVRAQVGFLDFVSFALKQNASVGALLEHALPQTPDAEWKVKNPIELGYRKNHVFFLSQVNSKSVSEQLNALLQSYLGRSAQFKVIAVAEEEKESQSIREKEKQSQGLKADELKKNFLGQEIVKQTKEIFGAEMTSFDIDSKSLT